MLDTISESPGGWGMLGTSARYKSQKRRERKPWLKECTVVLAKLPFSQNLSWGNSPLIYNQAPSKRLHLSTLQFALEQCATIVCNKDAKLRRLLCIVSEIDITIARQRSSADASSSRCFNRGDLYRGTCAVQPMFGRRRNRQTRPVCPGLSLYFWLGTLDARVVVTKWYLNRQIMSEE